MVTYFETLIFRLAIYFLKKGYGECPDYEKSCVVCQSEKARKFLENHIELIKY